MVALLHHPPFSTTGAISDCVENKKGSVAKRSFQTFKSFNDGSNKETLSNIFLLSILLSFSGI